MYKQLHEHNGKLVLIDYIGEEPKREDYAGNYYYDTIALPEARETVIPTLEQDRSTWLELSERCGGKLEENTHYIIADFGDEGIHDYMAFPLDKPIPTPQEDLWEEAIKNANEYAANKCYREELCRKVDYDLEFINYLKQTYENPTRKS